jgi:hypothetical protein
LNRSFKISGLFLLTFHVAMLLQFTSIMTALIKQPRANFILLYVAAIAFLLFVPSRLVVSRLLVMSAAVKRRFLGFTFGIVAIFVGLMVWQFYFFSESNPDFPLIFAVALSSIFEYLLYVAVVVAQRTRMIQARRAVVSPSTALPEDLTWSELR